MSAEPVLKCGLCHHLFLPSEGHECPSPEYLAARDALVAAAARAEEQFPLDELEKATFPKDER